MYNRFYFTHLFKQKDSHVITLIQKKKIFVLQHILFKYIPIAIFFLYFNVFATNFNVNSFFYFFILIYSSFLTYSDYQVHKKIIKSRLKILSFYFNHKCVYYFLYMPYIYLFQFFFSDLFVTSENFLDIGLRVKHYFVDNKLKNKIYN